jgi:hypothetical protein
MGIVNGGPALASTCWSIVDAVGESVTARAPHIPCQKYASLARTAFGGHLAVGPLVTHWLKHCRDSTRPAIIIEVWAASAALYYTGPLDQPNRRAYHSLG